MRRPMLSEMEKMGTEETQQQDVVGLQIPRKRVLARYKVSVQAGKLPRRKPRCTDQENEEDAE